MNKPKVKLSLVIFISALLFFVQASNTHAVEGTCSWHGGVDCSAMADWDGSAVCNDGWRDSSEIYSQMEECKVNRHYCTPAELNQIELKYDIVGKGKVLSDLNDQLQRLNGQSIELAKTVQNNPSISDLRLNQIQQSEIATQSLAILNKFYSAQSDFWNASNQVNRECWMLGDAEFQKSQADLYKQLQSSNTQYRNTPQYACPANSTLNAGNSCSCDGGYTNYNGQCVRTDNYCKLTYGTNSISEIVNGTERCACDTGYTWGPLKNVCIKSGLLSIPQPTPPLIEPSKEKLILPQSNILPKERAAPIIKRQDVGKRINTTTTVPQVITPLDQKGLSSQKPRTLWQKVVSPFNSATNFFRKLKFW